MDHYTSTLNYYNEQAQSFIDDTSAVDFSEVRGQFLAFLAPGDLILDFGSGSGRDAKAFMEMGYRVEATDGSEEICRLASEQLGIPVRRLLFNELDEKDKYEGIWACASILHVPKAELPEIFIKMRDALKMQGIIYSSFKYGAFEGERGGRYFSDFTEETLKELVDKAGGFSIEKMWITKDVREGRESEKWLNIILRKTAL